MAPKAAKSAEKPSKTPDKEKSSKKTKESLVPAQYILRAQEHQAKHRSTCFVSPEVLEMLNVRAGSLIEILHGMHTRTLLIESADLPASNIIQLDSRFVKLNGWLQGDRVTLQTPTATLSYASTVVVQHVASFTKEDVCEQLSLVGVLSAGLTDEANYRIVSIQTDDISKSLAQMTLNSSANAEQYLYHPKTTVVNLLSTTFIDPIDPVCSFQDVGALAAQTEQVKKTVSAALFQPGSFARFGVSPPRGLLLHGNAGVGKSLVLKCLGHEFPQAHVVRINPAAIIGSLLGETERALRGLWKEAITYQPSIIIMDDLSTLVPGGEASDENNARVSAALQALLDETDPLASVAVVAASTRPGDIDLALRRPGRFDSEIGLPVPDADGRTGILNRIVARMEDNACLLTQEELNAIGSRTHGYVGGDLVALVRQAVLSTVEAGRESLSEQDFIDAQTVVRPSAMREVVLEMPRVSWSDIGGQHKLKRKLREMVQLPLTRADAFRSLGIRAPKGLLLYGPPGCSKTMTAKALASESGLNFLAIKGPELFDKYVGESERRLREVFARARASAPSIVFIDEIDAIALARDSGESSNVAKQVLNTMLNEIDGVEELRGVVIIGATNRPDSIDSALLRPGRLDRHVYVSPPDAEARKEIFAKNVSKFGVDDELVKELVANSEGFSGSECVLLCQEAGLNAIMEVSGEDREDEAEAGEIKVQRVHFMKALGEISKNITQEMLEYYEEFGKKYGVV